MHQDIEKAKTPADWLRSEYLRRRTKNPAYTLRSFARHLDLPSGRVSELLSTKRKLTLEMANHIAESLAYPPDVKTAFVSLVDGQRKGSLQKRAGASKDAYEGISEDLFGLIADWQYFAILNLMKTSTFRNDPRWIASRLGLTPTEVRNAIDQLLRLEMIRVTPNNGLERVASRYVTTYGVPSAALRKSHTQTLEQTIAALEDVPLPLRDITSITFPADRDKIPLVKAEIKKFQRRMAKLMNSESTTAVYNLNVQLVPVTKEKL